MTRLRKLASLPAEERTLLLRAGIVVAVVRLLLWVMPWRPLHGMVRRNSFRVLSSRNLSKFSPDRLSWAVRTSSRVIPAATCLTQAVALQSLLTAADHASSICIGVTKDPDDRFHAHAWVEHEGAILINGTPHLARYSRITRFD